MGTPASVHPRRLQIGWLSDTFLCWLTPFMRQGYSTPFNMASLPALPAEDDASQLLHRFQSCWERAAPRSQQNGQRARAATIAVLTPRIQLIALWQILSIGTEATQPIIIRALVRDLRLGVTDLGFDYGLVALLVAAAVVSTIALQQVFWVSSRVGMRAKIALSAAVYSKTLRLDQRALLTTSAGQATNLVAIDVNRLELAFTFLHFAWSSPAMLVICGTLISFEVGVAATAGLSFLVVLFVVQRLVSTWMGRLRQRQAVQTDRRVKMMHDVLSGVEGLKVNGWEEALISRVDAHRVREQQLLKRSLSLLSMMEACVFFAPGLATFIVLAVHHYALDRRIEIEQAFAMLGLFNLLTKQLNVLPRTLKSLDESIISFRRIERFLTLPELPPARPVSSTPSSPQPPDHLSHLQVEAVDPMAVKLMATELSATERAELCLVDVSGRWASGSDEGETARPILDGASASASKSFMLSSINLELHRSDMCLVVGAVGSGKSSLLHLILREMPLVGGHICGAALGRDRSRGIGYAPQKPWILNATLRENILMGRPFEAAWYDEVVTRCAISHDLTSMPLGDQTQIGEKGVTISGGQKARISLARAAYGRPTLFLLDDPLSAVDQNVARHLVNQLLLGLLKKSGATVVLVTHQVQYAAQLADKVVVLEGGKVAACGTLAELLKRSSLEPSVQAVLHPAHAVAAVVAGGEGDNAPQPSSQPSPQQSPLKEPQKDDQTKPNDQPALDNGENESKKGLAEPSSLEMATAYPRSQALAFFLRSMGVWASLLVTLLFIGLGVCRAMADWSLGTWIRDGQSDDNSVLYCVLTGATAILGLLQAALFAERSIGAATLIHARALRRVLFAPKHFFDTTPLGSILAVFSKDLDSLDELLPVTTINLLKCVCIVVSSIIVCAIAVPAALGATPVLLLSFHKLTHFYQRSANQLKRLDKASSGPVYSSYAEALAGLVSLRAFGMASAFEARLVQQLALNHSAHFLWHASGRWFAVRLDALTALVIAVVSCCVLLFRDSLDPTLAALALTYVIQMASLFQWGFRLWAEVLNHFISVERFLVYTRLPQEAARVCDGDKQLEASSWPQKGSIVFEGVNMRYRPVLPLVLKEVSFVIEGGTKAALVGRTGAGKSSVALALSRVCELEEGCVLIDGVHVGRVGLTLLRNMLTFIQQDAVLFSGTIQSNLDPLGQHSEAELQRALKAVDFSRHAGVTLALNTSVAESGSDLSVGMRQLLVLARALLRRSRIVILDEATASVDMITDSTMQRLIRSEFVHSTILTIAHRLETILDYDLIVVMADGRVAENGPPQQLLKSPHSLFSKLVNTSGKHGLTDQLHSGA